MIKLEDIKKDAQIRGIQGSEIVRVVQTEPVGEHALTIYYKDTQGRLNEQMLFRSDEARLELAEAGRPGPGERQSGRLEAAGDRAGRDGAGGFQRADGAG